MNASQQQTSQTAAAPLVTAAGAGSVYDFPAFGHRIFSKVSTRDTGGAFAVGEVVAEKKGGVPPHIHSREEETFYVLDGRFEFQIGDETIEAGVGDTVFAPRDLMHTWRCVGETPGRFLLFITPGADFEAFANEMAQRNLVPARDMADPTLAAQFMALTEQYGIEMLPPVK